jgi:fructose/tagatose bisphosphate aldolase
MNHNQENDQKNRPHDHLMYAQKAYDQEPSDMLVAYDYGNALYQNGKYNEAMMVLEDIRQTDVNIIAYGDHGEGMSWAKSLLKNTENVINLCIRKQVCIFAEESADH